LVVIQFSTCNV